MTTSTSPTAPTVPTATPAPAPAHTKRRPGRPRAQPLPANAPTARTAPAPTRAQPTATELSQFSELSEKTENCQCVIYSRFSPRRNADRSESCEVQEAYCEEYAAKRGYTVVATYQDRALSGADEDRPALWDALRALSEGMVLLVYRRDRLARNVYLAETINMKVREGGSRIEAVNGDVDGDGPESILIRQVIAAISEYERKIIGMRTRAAMLHKQSKGQRMGRYAPYGFAIDSEDRNRLVPVPVEQDVCAEIVKLADLGHNPNSITRWLNTHRRDVCRSAEWTTRTVNKIISRSKQA